MSLTNSTQSYGSVTKVFHWVTAILIIALIPMGLIANQLPFETDTELARKAFLFSLHKTLGVLVFFVALARIIWAITQPKPGALHPDRRGETFLADLVHWLLYGSLVVVPLSGWIHHAATTGFAPIWWPFGQSLPLVPKDDGVAATFGNLHWIWTKIMGVSIALHVLGALKHQFIDKDATLARMWFGSPLLPQVTAHAAKITAPIIALSLFVLTGLASQALGVADHSKTPEAVELAEVTSSWEVQNGSLMIEVQQLGSAVEGAFADWTADINFNPDTKSGDVEVTIAIGSLTLGSVTSQAMGPDFFDADTFPRAVFSGPISHISDNQYVTAGQLTLKGTTLDVALSYTLTEDNGVWTMSGGTELDRRDFGIGLNQGENNLGFTVVIKTNLAATQS